MRAAAGGGRPVDMALRGITRMFLAGLDHYSDAQIEELDVELCRLVALVDAEARIELSGSLAPLPQAPPRVVRHLAFDEDAAVAGPVLGGSAHLASDDLAHLARFVNLDDFVLTLPSLYRRAVRGNGRARFRYRLNVLQHPGKIPFRRTARTPALETGE
ncbi:MAG: hypothetical protein HC900_11390, partial [Methylacidiphilales bacterium]|nr:hypothetical protein [Candidatus Methylacidiphilales bacterium]